MFLLFVASRSEKMKGLEGREVQGDCGRMVALVALQMGKERSWAGWRQLSHSPSCTSWTAPPMLRLLSERKVVHCLHLYRDWPLLFLLRDSKTLCIGPGGRSLQILPTTTNSECSVHGQKVRPHLLPSFRALTLLAICIFPQLSFCYCQL